MKKDIGFGLKENSFTPMLSEYDIWPFTIWEINYNSRLQSYLTKLIGDTYKNSTRKNAKTINNFRVKSNDSSISIFNPCLCLIIFKIFANKKIKIVYDPFAGGGTRALIASKLGYKYIGVELRKCEVDFINKILQKNKTTAKIILGDSRLVPEIKSNSADFLITCPPYYDLEKYSGGKNDLSMCKTYDEFLSGIEKCIKETHRILKKGAYSCWTIGITRDKEGNILHIPNDITKIHKKIGFKHKEEIIVSKKTGIYKQRAINFYHGNNYLIRTHEYVEVFIKE